jgi:hypothetical protein
VPLAFLRKATRATPARASAFVVDELIELAFEAGETASVGGDQALEASESGKHLSSEPIEREFCVLTLFDEVL